MTARLERSTAARFMRLTLGHLTRQWPYSPNHVLTGPDDLALPCDLHPIFHGSFDWHSCVHGWWQVLRLARRFPELAEAAAVEVLAERMFVAERVEGELAFLARPFAGGFERPYGWAWLLALHDEAGLRSDDRLARVLDPLARAIASRFEDYLPKLTHPIRSGKHDCTAFAMIHALAWARSHDPALAALIEDRSRDWFGIDRECRPWEPNGEDFLSATLCEAVLMRDVLGVEFAPWFARFMPDPWGADTACLRIPVHVSDRSDGRLAHLDGLNLARAWCWRTLAEVLPAAVSVHAVADAHLAAALPHLADDYMGEHWLATFAVLALEA